MFSFHKKNIYLADLLDGFCDIHCHLLPGVDDGSPDREHSLQLLERMHGMGVRELYMTPHIINGAYDNRSEEELRQRFADLGYTGPVKVRLGAEYFIDDRFPEHLAGNPLTMNHRHILVEFALNGYSLRAFDMLFEATLSGYEIILAHPERYTFVQVEGRDKVINLIKQYKLQLNLLSLAGYHGSGAKKCAENMLRQGLYTFVGTDTHSNAYLDALQRAKVSKKVFDAVNALKENNRMLF
ncbi:MAG TPA: capsular biosynthesis protein [Candidatus Tidjanibacter gallistercoris]|nr:capsular biosynthesis protein [Candidatus Tidjanibacter gallistercoris]